MDKVEKCIEELINEFVEAHHFQSIEAMFLYNESLKDLHREENCQECTGKIVNQCHEDSNADSGINCIAKSVCSFGRNSSIQENFGNIRSRLSRTSRRSVCVPKLRYSTSEGDSDETGNDSDDDNDDMCINNSIQSDEEVIIKERHLRKLSDSSSRCRSEDNVDNEEKRISNKLRDVNICSSDEDATKEVIVFNNGSHASISQKAISDVGDDDDDSDIHVRNKKQRDVRKISSGSSSDETEDDKKVVRLSISSDSASTADEASVCNSSVSDMVHSISKDNVFANSSSSGDDDDDDDYGEDKYSNFLSTCKEIKKSKTSDEYSHDEGDDTYDSDSFIVKNVKSIKKKKPLNTKVTNITTPKSRVRGIMTPKSSIRGIVNKLSATPMSVPGTLAYKRQFNKMRDGIVKELFALYNRTVFDNRLPVDLQIIWNKRMTKTAGFCYLTTLLNVRKSRIELSDKVIDSVERIRDTLIHELCHAATWIFEGKRGHGPAWKYWAKKANKEHTDLPVVSTCHNYEIQTKYKYQCDGCGIIFGRHSKSIDHSKQKCSQCGGRPLLISDNTSSSDSARKLNPYPAYVKEHFSRVKQLNPTFSPKDVMKKIGEDYKAFKITDSNKENVGTV